MNYKTTRGVCGFGFNVCGFGFNGVGYIYVTYRLHIKVSVTYQGANIGYIYKGEIAEGFPCGVFCFFLASLVSMFGFGFKLVLRHFGVECVKLKPRNETETDLRTASRKADKQQADKRTSRQADKQQAASSKQRAASSKQRAASSEQRAASSEQRAAGSRQQAASSNVQQADK